MFLDYELVINTTPRDLFNIYGDLENNDMENHFGSQLFDKSMVTKDENVNWFRNDVPGTTVDHVIVK